MATVINNRSSLKTDPIRNFRFLVTIKPLQGVTGMSSFANPLTFGFTSVSGLSVTTDAIPYREGGYNTTVHQIPGQTTFAPLTLQRGAIIGTSQNWDWMKHLFATVSGGSIAAANQNFRCDVEVAVLNHPVAGAGGTADEEFFANQTGGTTTTDQVVMRFNFYNAWPASVAYSDLNAADNAILVEQITLVHEGFDMTWGDLSTSGTFTNAPAI
jgi:phage tail-like protein